MQKASICFINEMVLRILSHLILEVNLVFGIVVFYHLFVSAIRVFLYFGTLISIRLSTGLTSLTWF